MQLSRKILGLGGPDRLGGGSGTLTSETLMVGLFLAFDLVVQLALSSARHGRKHLEVPRPVIFEFRSDLTVEGSTSCVICITSFKCMVRKAPLVIANALRRSGAAET